MLREPATVKRTSASYTNVWRLVDASSESSGARKRARRGQEEEEEPPALPDEGLVTEEAEALEPPMEQGPTQS